MVRVETIWNNFNRQLKSFILSKVHDPLLADDILQEAFVKIHLNMNSLKDETKLKPWIYSITRNLIADHFRMNPKTNRSLLTETSEQDENIGSDQMDEAIQDMINMLKDLPAGYCEALCMTELEGLSVKEYSIKAKISYPAAKSRVLRSRKALKDLLMNCCHYQFDTYGTVFDISPKCCCCCDS